MTQQADMMNVLGPKYPTLTQLQGTEISAWNPHVNWFGPGVVLPGYTGQNSTTYTGFLQNSVVPAIHNSGGLASYNHPFGTQDGPLLPASGMDSKLASVASALLASNVLGCDLLEVGYHLRGQCDLAHHLALWDVMSRNAVFLTGNGTSDDHAGVNWLSSQNNWFTACWAASTGLPDLLSALASGRAWCASLSAYRGALDLLVDGVVPMGKVSVSPVPSRLLAATATNLPAGSSLQVLQGAVDYAGQNALSANTVIVGSYPAASMAGGQVTQAVDTTGDSFVRTQVVSSGGAVIATSNPVWLLRTAPPGGIPAARAA
jgi:hypothetical protein